MAADIKPSTSGRNIGRLMIYALLLTFLGIIFFRYIKDIRPGFTSIPQEYQLNYLPADYQVDIDPQEALEILSNPQRNRQKFNQLVYDINLSILRHVANRMGLSDSLKAEVAREYEKHHPYLRNLYYNDFIAIKDTTSNLYQTWYDNEANNSVEVLNEIASKYTCFLVNQVMSTLIRTKEGSIFAKGQDVATPCGIAMSEALQPLIKRMKDRAAIDDFGRSRGLLQEKVEKVIAELATMEVRDKKGINKQLQTKIWGFSVSSTDLEISAISIMKVGFRLNDYFNIDLNARNGIVTVTLPEPTILSHEVYPKIDKMDIGWMREVQNVNLNESFNSLRAAFKQDAIESDIMDKSKTQAVELMNTMFAPLVSSMNRNYKLRVVFKGNSQDTEYEVPDQDYSLQD